jgi:tetratricopeptide (TPR) repeat protein
MKRLLPLLCLLLFPGTAPAPDIYKAFLDESRPSHRAIKETLALLEQHPDDASLYNDLGCLIAWDGFWRDALRNFDKAAQLDPKDAKPLFNAGLVQAWRGEWSSARAAFRKAVKRDPGNWPAWWMVGYSEERLDNVEAAVDAYKRSLRVDTSLFDVGKNPFAATSKLKGRVLLETYGSRMIRTWLPQEEQLENPERIGKFFQRSRPVPPGGAPVPPAPAATPVPPAAAAAGSAGVAAAPPPAPRARRATSSPPAASPVPGPVPRTPAAGPGAFPATAPTPHPPGG